VERISEAAQRAGTGPGAYYHGVRLIFQDLALIIWGGDPYTIPAPAMLSGAHQIGDLYFPVYRIFIIVVAAVVAFAPLLVSRRRGSGQ